MASSSLRSVCLALATALAGCGGSNVGDMPDSGPDAPVACTNNAQCDDDNICTIDRCLQGACDNAADTMLDGEMCDDGLACTINTRCMAGACAGDPLDCASMGDMCNTGTCDETQGGCVVAPVPDGTACDDATFCTTGDECTGGVCGGADRDCSGLDDECNVGTCDEATAACVATAVIDGTSCDDGVFCTDGDTCTAGACGGAPRDCSGAGDACNVGTCDEAAGACVPTPANEGDPCDDSLFCTTGDTCTAGACGGAPRDCTSASDACNVGTCDDTADACVPTPANEGGSCDDGLFCTTGDICTTGTCGGAPRDCTAFDNACNLGTCNEGGDTCQATPANEGGVCDDGLFCTTGDACLSGVCAGASSLSCNDMDSCTTDSCDEGSNSCVNTLTPVPGAEGPPGSASCSDSVDNDCDGDVDLADANCTGCVTPADCDDGNPCTGQTCTLGICSNPPLTGGACDDGLFCTTGDACSSGTCAGAPRDCSAVANACNAGFCSEAGDACVPVPANEGGACSDGLFCTVGDICTAGACSGGARDCSGVSNACNNGVCNEVADACNAVPTNEGGVCVDGLFCTVGDVCTTGVCGGGARDCSAAADACNSGVCNEATDVCAPSPLPPGTPCNAFFCATGETCTAGVCGGGTPVTCSDGNTCTGDVCNESTDMCSNPTRQIDPASTVATTSDDGTPLTVCLVAGSGARFVAWVDLRDTAGAPMSGGTVTIGGTAATASTAQPGIYWREVVAGATLGTAPLAVTASACGDMETLASITVTTVAANATTGGTAGCSPTDGNVRVRVVEAETGAAISGASVLVGSASGTPFEHAPEALFGGASSGATNLLTTDPMGYVSFYDYGAALAGPITVTAGATNRALFTLADGNASDVVLPLPLLHPAVASTTVYGNTASSTSTWPPTGCNDVDAGIVLPKLKLDFFSAFDVAELMGKERCWDSMNGLVGVQALPENLYLPSQGIGPLCLGGTLAQASWSLTLKDTVSTGVTENVGMVLTSAPYTDVQAALMSGAIADLLVILTYRRIGFLLNETVPTAPTGTRSIVMNETYPNNFVVTYSGRPTDADVVGFTAGDYAGTNGTGPSFLIGTRVNEWDAGLTSITIPNSDLNATGGGVMMPSGIRRYASVAALYLGDATVHPTIPANRLSGITTQLIRGTATGAAPFGTTGGTGTVSSWLGISGPTFTAPDSFAWENATASGNQPLYSVHELVLKSDRYHPVLTACQTENEVRSDVSVQWIVMKPFQLNCGANECFTLPTLPATFPRGTAGVQQKSGFETKVGSGAACTGPASCLVAGEACVDPDGTGSAGNMCMSGAGTAASPYTTQEYEWRMHLYDLELAPSFDFNSFVFSDRIVYMTHESSNRAFFD